MQFPKHLHWVLDAVDLMKLNSILTMILNYTCNYSIVINSNSGTKEGVKAPRIVILVLVVRITYSSITTITSNSKKNKRRSRRA